jgi:hypothetical protein
MTRPIAGLLAVLAAAVTAIAGLVVGLDSPARSAGDEIEIDRSAFAARAASVGERFDFVPMLQPIAPLIASADLAICQMEMPIGWPGAPAGVVGTLPNGAELSMPPFEITTALASTGFDRCSTASNHSYDGGPDGIASTIDALHGWGLSHVGTARSPSETVDRLFDIDGLIAVMQFDETATGDFVSRHSAVGICNETWTRTVYAPSVHRPMADPTSDLARQLDRCSMRLRSVVPGVR